MAIETQIPDPPRSRMDPTRPESFKPWQMWFEQIGRALSRLGAIQWTLINKTGSKLSDIETRTHAMLQSVLGWTSGTDVVQDKHISQADGKNWEDHRNDGSLHVPNHVAAVDPHPQYATDADLSAHTGNTSNPHNVTATQVGNTTAQWNANKITETSGPTVLTIGAVADGQMLKRVGGTLVGSSAAAGSFSAKQVTVNLGATPVDAKEITITDVDCTSSSKVIPSMACVATVDNDADEVEMSGVVCSPGTPGTGNFTLYIMAHEGPIQGHFAINYALG